VRPGVYTERVEIERPITVVGDGPSEEIILQCEDSSGIWARSAGITLRGLTIRSVAPAGAGYNGLYVKKGRLVVERCRLESTSGAAVATEREETHVLLRDCVIHGAQGSGIYAKKDSSVEAVGCDIVDNSGPGIAVQSGARAVVRSCRVTRNGNHGVYVYEGGRATVRDCDLRDNQPGPFHVDGDSELEESGNHV
jgi:F-box protein 11